MQCSLSFFFILRLKRIILMKSLFFFIMLSLFSFDSISQESETSQNSDSCLDLQIEVLAEPFCQGGLNGGQLKVNVAGGSGDYSYEWLTSDGNFIPGGPQTSATTLSFLSVNQVYWAYVTDNLSNCYDSISFVFNEYVCQEDTASLEIHSLFDVNPVGYNQYSECEVKLINLGCELSFKPEFIISNSSDNIDLEDFIIEYYNAQSTWEEIPYFINFEGNAVGYWGGQNGETANCDYTQFRPVRVKFNQFNPAAPTGEYTATLRLWSVDESGNLLSIISESESVTLTLMDTICEDLSIISQLSDATCSQQDDAQILLSGNGGNDPYLFSLNNSSFSTDSIYDSLSYGVYYASIKDSQGCQNSDTLYLGPEPVLPDTIWFSDITSVSANVVWDSNPLTDGYKFRYREVGQPWQGPVSSGFYANGIAEMLAYKTLSNLSSLTTYELQVKANSITGCEEGWSSEIYTFTTAFGTYTYNVSNTCVGVNSGQIEFDMISTNSYTFNWQGPDDFISSESSIYNLSEGDYNLQLSYFDTIIFDTTFVVSVSDSDIGISLNGDPSLVFSSEDDGVYYAQACDMNSYIVADSGFFNYSWNYGDSLNYIQNQQILIDTSNVFIQVEALDTNNCTLSSDSIFISLVSDFVNLFEANVSEDYIEDVYVFCSADSVLNIDINPFVSGNYLIEWRQAVGVNSIVLSNSSSIDLNPIQNTAYTLTISSCSFDFYVNYYQSPFLDVQNTNLSCYGDDNASIYIATDSSNIIYYSLTDSSSNLVYSNSSIFLTDTVENLSAGTYTVEVTNSESLCIASEEVDLLQADSLHFDSTQIENIECYGQSLGAITFNISGGVAPYTFILNGDTIIPLINSLGYFYVENLIAADYTIEVVDFNLCYNSLDFEIIELAEMFFSVDEYSDTLSCFGDSTAFISLNAFGGSPSYTFDLYNTDSLFIQQSSTMFTSLPANTYEVFMTDSYGCRDSLTITINQHPQLILTEDIDLHQDILCNNENTGFISINVEGGDFNLANPSFTLSFDSLNSGYYSFEIIDSSFCSSSIDSIQITEPEELNLSLSSLQNIDCSNSLGNIEFEVNGGISPYTYTLNEIGSFEVPMSNQSTISSLVQGDYIVNLFDSNSCVDSLIFIIDDLSIFNVSISSIFDTLLCYGDSTGFVEFELQNITEPYTFELFNNGDTLAIQNTNLFENLAVGDYSVLFADTLGCQHELSFTIVADQAIISDSLNFHQDVSCNGGNDGAFMLHIQSVLPSHIVRLTDSLNTLYPWYSHPNLFDSLSAGIYTVEVAISEDDDCPNFYEVEIVQPQPFFIDSILVTDVLCNGESTGSLEAFFTGGVSEFTYLFNDDSTIFSNQLQAAAYSLEVSDFNGCTVDTNFLVNEPEELILTLIDSITFNVSCFGKNDGQIGLEASGGVPPYSYSILGDLTQESNIIDALFADTFVVAVTDSLGCQDTLTVVITQPELSVLIESYELSDSLGYCSLCYGDSTGNINLTVAGGLPAYEYFMVNTTDTFNNSYFDQLVGGQQYQFFAVDAQGCSSDTISIECTSPEELQIDIETTLPSCCYSCDLEATLFASGGMAPYNYGLDNGIFQTDSVFNQLCGDSFYIFKIIDSYGCEEESNTLLQNTICLSVDTINYIDPDLPALEYDACQVDGTAKIYTSANEGLGNYSFSIDNEPFIQQNEIMFDSLSQGAHLIVVKDDANCLDTLSFEVNAPNPIIISDLTIDTIFCGAPAVNNSTDLSDLGLIHAEASGASSGVYFYSLDQIDSSSYQPAGLFEQLDSGYYSLNVIDLNDCVEEFEIYIPFYSASVEYNAIDVSCPNFNDGIIEIDSIIGELNPLLTLNDISSTDNYFPFLTAGEYNLTLNYLVPNSSETCVYSEVIEISDKEPLGFTYDLLNSSCYNSCDGEINIGQIDGGTSPYTVLCVNTLDTGLVFDNLCADEYAIKLIDSNGCFIIQEIVVHEPNAIYPLVDFQDGQLLVLEPTLENPSYGIPPYFYQWYNSNGEIIGANDSIYQPITLDSYYVVVTDSKECEGTSSAYTVEVLGMSYLDNSSVYIYPNPFKGVLNISTELEQPVHWQISDATGRVVQSGFDAFSWQIYTSKLMNGIYFLKLKSENDHLIYKIVKQ